MSVWPGRGARLVCAVCVWWLLGGASTLAASVLTPVAGSPFLTGDDPVSVAFSPTGGLLATANDDAGTVSVFAANSSTGALREVAGSPFVTHRDPVSVAFSPTGGLLATLSQQDGAVSVFAVNASTGALTEVPGSPFVTSPMYSDPESMAFSPSGRLLAVANYEDGSVSVFAVNGSTGALRQVAGSPFATGGLSYPGSVAFSPSGGLLATANYVNRTVSVFAVSASTGALTEVPRSPFPAGTKSNPESVAFSPSGGFLAVANNAHTSLGSVSVFSVNPAGALTRVAGSPFATGSASGPESVVFSPTGGLLATANLIAGTVSVFAANTSTGALTEVAGSPFATGRDPGSVAFSPKGGLLAVANEITVINGRNRGTVSVFSIAPSSAGVTSPTGRGVKPSNKIVVSHIKTDADATLTFQARVPGSGKLDLLETVWAGSHRLASGLGHASATHTGVIHLRVSLNPHDKQLVHRHPSGVVLRLSVTYTPTHGIKRTITFYGLHLGGGCPATAKGSDHTRTNCAATTPTNTTTTPTTTTPVGTVASTIDVSMHEFSFTLTENGAPIASVPSGQVTFVVTDNGTIQHNFDLVNVHMGVLLGPGQSQSFTVSLSPGSYKYQCDIPGHADAGMKGTLTVTPAGR